MYIYVKSMLYMYFKFLFQIIVDSHAVLRNIADISHIYITWFPPLVKLSYKTIAKIHKENSLTLFKFHQFCLHLCAWVAVFSFMQMYHMCRFMSPPSQ